jgi:hypothetical protein
VLDKGAPVQGPHTYRVQQRSPPGRGLSNTFWAGAGVGLVQAGTVLLSTVLLSTVLLSTVLLSPGVAQDRGSTGQG